MVEIEVLDINRILEIKLQEDDFNNYDVEIEQTIAINDQEYYFYWSYDFNFLTVKNPYGIEINDIYKHDNLTPCYVQEIDNIIKHMDNYIEFIQLIFELINSEIINFTAIAKELDNNYQVIKKEVNFKVEHIQTKILID